MRRGAAVLALVLSTIYVGGPTPALARGHGGSGHTAGSAHGFLAGQAHSTLTASLRAHFAPHVGGSTLVTRPAPPLQHAFGGFPMHHHHHHHGPVFAFVEPPFFSPVFSPFFSPFFYGYAYPYSPLYDFRAPPTYAEAPPTVAAPFFCWIDGIGFTDEGRFAHHLHEVHGVPLDEALSASEIVDGRYIFFGY
jgi:hypothetical protein